MTLPIVNYCRVFSTISERFLSYWASAVVYLFQLFTSRDIGYGRSFLDFGSIVFSLVQTSSDRSHW